MQLQSCILYFTSLADHNQANRFGPAGSFLLLLPLKNIFLFSFCIFLNKTFISFFNLTSLFIVKASFLLILQWREKKLRYKRRQISVNTDGLTNKHRLARQHKDIKTLGRSGGQVVSVLAFSYDDPSL